MDLIPFSKPDLENFSTGQYGENSSDGTAIMPSPP